MNPTARMVMLGVAGLMLVMLFTAAAPTNEPPVPVPRLFAYGTTNLYVDPSISAPRVYLDRKPASPRPLAPGVYQTRPYSMILVVPKAMHDDWCVIGATGAGSKMPVVTPELRVVPMPPGK